MADLSFGHDAGMQDGKGDNEYMDFVHKYMAAVGVCPLPLSLKELFPNNKARLSPPFVPSASSFRSSPKPQMCETSVSVAKLCSQNARS
jgi:hypothetical protein